MRLRCTGLVYGSIFCCSRLAAAQQSIPTLTTAADTAQALRVVTIDRAPALLGGAAPPFARAMLVAVAVSSVVSLQDGAIMREVGKMRASGDGLKGVSSFCSSFGAGIPVALGVGLWAGGAITHHDFVQRLGVETTQSVMLSGALTIGIKGLIGRARPSAAPDDPDQYYPGRGFLDSKRASFPSGHTSAAFAVATVLSRELSARHPERRRWIRGLLFGGASAVGLSRVYQNAHWPSDVVTGAALGTLSGMQVLSWHPGAR